MNLNVPTESGGSGLGVTDQCLIVEELAHACGGMTTSVIANCLALEPILLGGTPEQKDRILKPFCAEYHLASFCLTEPSGGSDAGGLKTRARRDGDHYVLDGEKCFITNAPHASLYTVFATVDPSLRHKGITAFVVPRSAEGVTPGKDEEKMGHRASSTSTVHFAGVRVPVSDRLGADGDGFSLAMRTLDQTRTPIGALATGIAQAALDHAAAYSLQRQTFGKPIAEHQAIQIKLANMAQAVHAARLLTWHAAWTIDHGAKGTLEYVDRQVLRLGRGAPRRRRGDPDVRRVRIHEGVPGREAPARREAHPDLRGRERDPAYRHRPRAPPALRLSRRARGNSRLREARPRSGDAPSSLYPDGRTLDPKSVKFVLAGYDESAVEQALLLKESTPGSKVHIISCKAPPDRGSPAVRGAGPYDTTWTFDPGVDSFSGGPLDRDSVVAREQLHGFGVEVVPYGRSSKARLRFGDGLHATTISTGPARLPGGWESGGARGAAAALGSRSRPRRIWVSFTVAQELSTGYSFMYPLRQTWIA